MLSISGQGLSVTYCTSQIAEEIQEVKCCTEMVEQKLKSVDCDHIGLPALSLFLPLSVTSLFSFSYPTIALAFDRGKKVENAFKELSKV